MSVLARDASAAEAAMVWPAVKRAGAFASAAEFERFRETVPWAVRANDRGEACVCSPWRALRPILAIRALVCADYRVGAWVEDLRAIGEEHGFGALLSPLLPLEWLGPYRAAGMRPVARLVALRANPARVARVAAPEGVSLRPARDSDVDALLSLDHACFDSLWRYGSAEIAQLTSGGRLVVAEVRGDIIGYTHSTVAGRVHTLGRLAVGPSWRRRGVGAALVAEAACHADRSGGAEVSLCTQEENGASRALYRAVGFAELPGRYGLAMLGDDAEGRPLC